jgi:hypothetical protein
METKRDDTDNGICLVRDGGDVKVHMLDVHELDVAYGDDSHMFYSWKDLWDEYEKWTDDLDLEVSDYYKHKYGGNIPNLELPQLDTNTSILSLKPVDDMTLPEALNVELQIQTYAELLRNKINSLDSSRVTAITNIGGIKYLLLWFNYAMDTQLNRENFSKKELNSLSKWFIKYGDPNMFKFTHGHYVGKRSIQVGIEYTEWCDSQNLHCHIYEGDKEWSYRGSHPENLKRYAYKLTELLNPLSPSELNDRFDAIDKTCENDEFMLELVKYIHCHGFPNFSECETETTLPFITMNVACNEFDY